MLSLTSEYALRAVIILAQQQEDQPLSARVVADRAGVPEKYLSKILGDLVRAGVLEASRGKGGGFRLSRAAREIPLFEVLAPFERFDKRRCPFGNKECSDVDPCLAHEQWKHVIEAFRSFLTRMTIHAVATPVRAGRSRRRKAGPSSRRKR